MPLSQTIIYMRKETSNKKDSRGWRQNIPFFDLKIYHKRFNFIFI